jgi:hypothetical protein
VPDEGLGVDDRDPGRDGDRLYETPAPPGPVDSQPTTETLDVIGHGRRVLATDTPGSIDPGSVMFSGGMVTWTEDGVTHSAASGTGQ